MISFLEWFLPHGDLLMVYIDIQTLKVAQVLEFGFRWSASKVTELFRLASCLSKYFAYLIAKKIVGL